MKVFIVLHKVDYENTTNIVGAFSSEKKAKKFNNSYPDYRCDENWIYPTWESGNYTVNIEEMEVQ